MRGNRQNVMRVLAAAIVVSAALADVVGPTLHGLSPATVLNAGTNAVARGRVASVPRRVARTNHVRWNAASERGGDFPPRLWRDSVADLCIGDVALNVIGALATTKLVSREAGFPAPPMPPLEAGRIVFVVWPRRYLGAATALANHTQFYHREVAA